MQFAGKVSTKTINANANLMQSFYRPRDVTFTWWRRRSGKRRSAPSSPLLVPLTFLFCEIDFLIKNLFAGENIANKREPLKKNSYNTSCINLEVMIEY